MPSFPFSFIFGTNGDDNLPGTPGVDFIFGLRGDDVIDSGAGNDFTFAGRGDDTIVWSAGDGNDYADGGRGQDNVAVETDGDLMVSLGASRTKFSDDGDTLKATRIETVEIDMTTGGLVSFDGNLSRSKVETIEVTGSSDADIIDASATTGSGSGTSIQVFGGDGDDLFLSGAGDDMFDGGLGTDTASYMGLSADYDISIENGIVTVTDLNPFDADGDRGTDQFDSVERLAFADQSVLIVGSNEFASVEDAVNAALSGDTILISDETVALSTLGDASPAQIIIDKDLEIVGADDEDSKIVAIADTGGVGDARAMFLVNEGANLDVSNVAIDGSGFQTFQAFRMFGSGSFDNVSFSNIVFGPYQGTAITAIGVGGSLNQVDVTNSDFSNIGRIGAQWFGPNATGTFAGNSYSGKGSGDFLDYAVELGNGANVTITGGNVISGLNGVASSDGSVSAGILISTSFGPGTTALIEDTLVEDSSYGVAVGFDFADSSNVTFGSDVDVSDVTGVGLLVRGNGVLTNTREIDGTVEWFGGVEQNMVTGAQSGDFLLGGANDDVLRGFQGDDTIGGEAGNDRLIGNRGNDFLSGGDDDDVLRGGRDNDTLFGDGGMDRLFGGSGTDIINGGDADAADDRLNGGVDADIFAFTGLPDNNIGNDVIRDWEDGLDFIAFDDDMEADLISASTVGSDFVFDFGTYSVTVADAGGQTFTQGALGSGADFEFFIT